MRAIIMALAIAIVGIGSAGELRAGDLMYGCWSRPACGKVCKLVCETKKLAAVGYGCECETICIPGPSRPGCKHCYTTCCCGGDVEGCQPKIEFCWYDWFACGCAKPRTIRLLTKYGAEKEVCAYHWEVVDGCACGCCAANGAVGQAGCRCVYKPAPAEAQVGDVIELTRDEQVELTSWTPAEDTAGLADTSTSERDGTESTAWQRLAKVWGASDDQK